MHSLVFANGAVTGAFSRLFNDELHYDGKSLKWLDDDGNLVDEYLGWSGREGYQDSKYQDRKGIGPIPEGEYTAPIKRYQRLPTAEP